MKIYFNGEEEIYESSDDEEEEIFNMKPKPKKIEKKNKFDIDNFDYKVAKSIVDIHKNKKLDEKFSKWVEKNLEHLNSLYKISSFNCSPVDFYTYIYENSK